MVTKVMIEKVLGYSENEYQNPRTGERRQIRSFSLIVKDGKDSFIADASDDEAERLKNLNLEPDNMALVNLSFYASASEKDGKVSYWQRVRIERLIPETKAF